MTDKSTDCRTVFYDIIETAPYEGSKHHYIVQMGKQEKVCEVFSQANKELVLNALNSQAAWNQTDKLREAVIVLEDGEEPKVGDFVYTWQTSEADSEWEHTSHDYVTITAVIPNLTGNGKTYEATKTGREDCTYRLWGSAGFKIIRRHNKPVIYKSELEEVCK